jgi:hypothetical protein
MSETKLIYSKISAVMGDLKAIEKSKINQFGSKFKFRGIDDVYNHLNPILANHGVFSVPEVLEDRTEERKSNKGGTLIYRIFKMKYTFYAEDGSNVSAIVIGEAMDSGDKASNKAMSIAHKYAFIQVFAIPTENIDDPDEQTYEVKPKQLSFDDKVDAMIKAFGALNPPQTVEMILDSVCKESLEDLTEDDLIKLRDAYERIIKK